MRRPKCVLAIGVWAVRGVLAPGAADRSSMRLMLNEIGC